MAVSEGTERPGVMEWVKRRLIKNPGMLSAPSDVYGAVKGAGYAAQAMAPVAERAIPDAVTKYAGLASIPFVGPSVAAGEAIRANLPGESRERFNPGTDERTAPMNPGTYEPDATGRELPGGYGMKPTATRPSFGYDRRAADEERALLQRRVILANQNAGRGFDQAQTEDMRQHALALSQGISAYDAGRARGGSAPVMNAAQAHADKLLGAYQTQHDQRVAEANMERELIKAQGERAIREAREGPPGDALQRMRDEVESEKLKGELAGVRETNRTGFSPEQRATLPSLASNAPNEFYRNPDNVDQIAARGLSDQESVLNILRALNPDQQPAAARMILASMPNPAILDEKIVKPGISDLLGILGAPEAYRAITKLIREPKQRGAVDRMKQFYAKLQAMAGSGAMPAEARQR